MPDKFIMVKDPDAKKIHVEREFNAPISVVWKAWTDPAILEKWWGPKPWIAKTRSMDFRVGGSWLYAMEGPERQQHWSNVIFTTIEIERRFATEAVFSDEHGEPAPGAPITYWDNKFISLDNTTRVIVDLSFGKEADFILMVEMGFEGGFTIGLNQLEVLLG